jgi:GNAT superfamily N-acetyltransferase
MTIIEVPPGSSLFAQVLKLWRSESRQLGLMPEGAFDDHARAGCLLAAVNDDRVLVGYAMFRRTVRRTAAIAHLCVHRSHRGGGVARVLFEAIKARCTDCFEIHARCRRDFAANALWPKLGFVAVGEEPARAKDCFLTIWRYEVRPLPLFRLLSQQAPSAKTLVVIDANVFFDLDDQTPPDGMSEQSKGLLADWLTELVDFAVADELYNEINRRADPVDRGRQRDRSQRFAQLQRDPSREEATKQEVSSLLPPNARVSRDSDVRQLAMTIAGGVNIFITRDEEILDVADELYDAFELKTLRPHEFVRSIDEIRRETEYQPRRLHVGPGVSVSLARSEDLQPLAELMHAGHVAPEPRRRTVGRLRDMLAAPERFEVVCVRRGDEILVAYALERPRSECLMVPFFAAAPTALARTAARHSAEVIVETAEREHRKVVRVEHADPRIAEALQALGFSYESDSWIKLTLPIVLPPERFADEVEHAGAGVPGAAALAARIADEVRALAHGPGLARATIAELERALWPAKLTSLGMPCFIVPIQPRWAAQLFDRELALGTLFGAEPTLALNNENVYYRAAHPAVISAPSRVLWYVSDDARYPGSMAIRACSQVEEVVVGPAKELFRRFQRLGVYTWRDVFALAKEDATRRIMAFRFSRTELLPRAIPWSEAQAALRKHTGKASRIQSPVMISEECFLDFYRRGGRADAA